MLKDSKDVEYKGNFTEIMHIFQKECSCPHKNLAQAKFESGLRRNSLVENKERFDLIPYTDKGKVISYLPPCTASATKAFDKIPYKQQMREEKIKPLGKRPHTVNKITSL